MRQAQGSPADLVSIGWILPKRKSESLNRDMDLSRGICTNTMHITNPCQYLFIKVSHDLERKGNLAQCLIFPAVSLLFYLLLSLYLIPGMCVDKLVPMLKSTEISRGFHN